MAVCLLLLLTHCQRKGSNESWKPAMQKCVAAAFEGNFRQSDYIADSLLSAAYKSGDQRAVVAGLFCKGIYNFNPADAPARIRYINEAESIAVHLDDPELLSSIYNVKGMYATAWKHDYASAQTYFSKAVKEARKTGNKEFEVSAECNLSEVYRMMEDTLGIEYDKEIYRFAVDTDNRSLLNSSASHCAEYYLRRRETAEEALPYIRALEKAGLVKRALTLSGSYYLLMDSVPQAMAVLEKAATMDEGKSHIVFRLYAEALNRLGRYRESQVWADSALMTMDRQDLNSSTRASLLRLKADNAMHAGDRQEAFELLSRYHQLNDSLISRRYDVEVARMKIEYELEKKELAAAQRQKELKSQIRIWIGISVFLLLLTGALVMSIYTRRRLHKGIVAQSIDYINREKMLKADLGIPEPPAPENSVKVLKREQAEEIFAKIKKEIEVNRIYADPTVSREIFAERIGCNRTYLGQAVKMMTGKTYLEYMNYVRIHEALRLLSQPRFSTPIRQLAQDLGFLSHSSFYSTFKKQVGMTPTEYRNHAAELAQARRPVDLEEDDPD